MLAVEPKRSCVRGTDAQLSGLDAMPAHKIHGVVLKFGADARASHLLNQVKEVHIPAPRLFEDLHLHLADDLVALPDVNVPAWEPGCAQPKLLDIVRPLGIGFIQKTVLTEAASIRVAPESDTHGGVRVEVDGLENELHGLNNLRLRNF